MKLSYCFPRAVFLGQGAAEYVLIGSLIAVVAVVSLALLGGNINQLFSGLFFKSSPVVSSQAASSPSGSAGAAIVSSGSKAVPGMAKVSLTLSNGKRITLDNYPADLEKAILTAGTNGTTRLMADNMRALAKQLLAAGEITPLESQKLLDLANKGHALAEAERLVEEGFKAAGWKETMALAAPVQINGKSYTLEQAADELYVFYSNDPGGNEVWMAADDGDYSLAMERVANGYKGWSGTGTIMGPFVEGYEDALKSGALTNPAVKSVVDELTLKIIHLGHAMGWAQPEMVRSGEVAPSEALLLDYMKRDIPVSLFATEATHTHSAGICGTGHGQDTGIQCQ